VRMGRDKALLDLDGMPLILRVAHLLEPLTGRPTVIGQPDKFDGLDVNGVGDDQPGFGPLGAIATALHHADKTWNLIVGCDLPFLTNPWLEYLIQRALHSSMDVVMPRSEGGLEPLCAMYHQRCERAISTALARGVRKVTDGLVDLRMEIIEPAEWKAFDSDGLLFKNMNSLADYEEVQSRLDRKRQA
jgi:molybdopterin-guanine dinucleotide biosynthesis protein A